MKSDNSNMFATIVFNSMEMANLNERGSAKRENTEHLYDHIGCYSDTKDV